MLWQAFRSFSNGVSSFGILIPLIWFLREMPFSFFVFHIWLLKSISELISCGLWVVGCGLGQFAFSRLIPFSFAIRVVICGMIG